MRNTWNSENHNFMNLSKNWNQRVTNQHRSQERQTSLGKIYGAAHLTGTDAVGHCSEEFRKTFL